MEHDKTKNTDALLQMLMTSTFRISPSEWKTANDTKDNDTLASIAVKCAKRAYRDYNRTLEFKNQKSDHKEFRKALYDITLDQVDDLIIEGRKGQDEFDDRHIKACEAIKDKANEQKVLDESFSYGQAQKQLNMTLKYMWLLGLWDINSITDKLHATVDNYIIKAAWNFDNEKVPLPLKNPNTNRSSTKYDSYKLSTPWSQWDKDTYTAFQYHLRDFVVSDEGREFIASLNKNYSYDCVFEWELNAWNDIASDSDSE